MLDNLLKIRDLTVDLMTAYAVVHAARGVNLDVKRNEILGVVGESGCGKSVMSKSILRLNDAMRSRVTGSIDFDGTELTSLSGREISHIRGGKISMVFQEPMTSLSPLKTVAAQIEGAIENHMKLSKAARRERALTLLQRVGLPAARARQYPFELSGGMRQRVMIAQAIACSPQLVIADEPTTALDVTIQAQILSLLLDLQRETQMSVLFVTHNFGIVSQICDRVSVMYAGKIVETAKTSEILSQPLHPYTKALIECIPRMAGGGRLRTVEGSPPPPYGFVEGCAFYPRCKYKDERCEICPRPKDYGTHTVSCHHPLATLESGEGI